MSFQESETETNISLQGIVYKYKSFTRGLRSLSLSGNEVCKKSDFNDFEIWSDIYSETKTLSDSEKNQKTYWLV